MSNLINGFYPISYFTLAGVDEIQYPDSFWWSSKQRFAVEGTDGEYLTAAAGGNRTIEYLEIDLGRIREINYLNLDVVRAPINITIEFSNSISGHTDWVLVQPKTELPFDDHVFYDSANRTGWFNADFYFTNAKDKIVSARYVRIGLARRDEAWPVSTATPFRWPVFIKHLRLGRYISSPTDTVGPLLIQDTPQSPAALQIPTAGSGTHEVRQAFVYPADAARGNIIPKITGFGVALDTSALNGLNTAIDWSLWDVTSIPALLQQGTESGALISAPQNWFDIYFTEDQYIDGSLAKIYELRIKSVDAAICNTAYTVTPNLLSASAVPGTLTFTHNSTAVTTTLDTQAVVRAGMLLTNARNPGAVYLINTVGPGAITLSTPYREPTAAGATGSIIYPLTYFNAATNQYVIDGTRNLVCRVWGDVADNGRDVLGNTYRYGVRQQSAENVLDSSQAGWMSQPAPTPDAVEALYFDVRTDTGDSGLTPTVVDAVRINPRTPGVRMNIYYSKQGVNGETPSTTNEWDYLLWTPVSHQSYTLRRNQVIEFPHQVNACFIKLEFTNLNPLPYFIPNFPALPPRRYRRYPIWVETQFSNSQVKNTITDWFTRNATPVQTKVLATLTDPVREFEYQEREFLTALALGEIADQQTINSGIVDVANRAFIDPTTASKIYLSDPSQYRGSLNLTVDQSSILGQTVVQRTSSNPAGPAERQHIPSVTDSIPVVSTPNARLSEAYQTLAQTPMWFNRTCRHVYREDVGYLNRKAYFVGIQDVNFLRTDFTALRDDQLIIEDFGDDLFLESNTWSREATTSIPSGTTVFVSYTVQTEPPIEVADEELILPGYESIRLSQNNGPAADVLMFTNPNRQGIQYFQNVDYELGYTSANGVRANYIARSALAGRLIAPLQAINYLDAALVRGIGVIPQASTFDAAVVVGVGVPSTDDTPFLPTYGTGTYGGVDSSYGNLSGRPIDSAVVVGTGHPSSLSFDTSTDSHTVTGVGHPSVVEVFIP